MHVNNETGSLQPVEEIGEIIRDFRGRHGTDRPLFHVDAVQSFARYSLDPRRWGVDLLTISGHKIGAPKGVGALYVREGVRLEPLVVGGQQESGLRAGTENVPGIVGLGEAAQAMGNEGAELRRRWARLRSQLVGQLESRAERWFVNGSDLSVPHIINLSFPGVPGEVMTRHLEARGIYVSTGSACHSRSAKSSHVLTAMGLPEDRSRAAIRVSLGPRTEHDDIDALVQGLVQVSGEIRAMKGGLPR